MKKTTSFTCVGPFFDSCKYSLLIAEHKLRDQLQDNKRYDTKTTPSRDQYKRSQRRTVIMSTKK